MAIQYYSGKMPQLVSFKLGFADHCNLLHIRKSYLSFYMSELRTLLKFRLLAEYFYLWAVNNFIMHFSFVYV